MSSSSKIDHIKKDILILGKGPTQGLEHTLSAGKKYSINLQKKTKNCVEVCIILKKIVICLLTVQKFINLKQKILKLMHIHYV